MRSSKVVTDDVATEIENIAGGEADVAWISEDGTQFVLKSEWAGKCIQRAQDSGFKVDTVNAFKDRAEIRFSRSD